MRLLNYLFVPLLSLAVALAVVSVILVPDDRVLAQELGQEDYYLRPSGNCRGCTRCIGTPPPCRLQDCPLGRDCEATCLCTLYAGLCWCRE